MQLRGILTLAVVVAVAPAVVSGQAATQPPAQSPGIIMSGMTFQSPKLLKPQPYEFRIWAPQPPIDSKKPTIVCGLTLKDADQTFDAAMRRNVPQADDTTRFTVRAVQPTICTRAAQ